MTEYVDCLASFLDELRIGAAHVCGLSWGGVLAQEFYGRYRDRVRSLVLADTYAGWRGSLGETTAEERRASCLRDSERPARDWIPAWIPGLFTPAATAETRAGYEAIMLDFHPSGFRTMSHAVADSDTRAILATVAVPTLLIWGEDDQRSPRPIQEAFSAALPAAPIVGLPTGHVSNVERPDLFNKALIEFCESVERSEAPLPR
jgi:pimeloyl-ACP methyl ester carboxylesterase